MARPKGPLDRFRLDIGVLVGLVLLLVGVALLSQDVRLDAPFAEDGWQGGWPMLAYGSPLLFLAAWPAGAFEVTGNLACW